MIDYRLFDTFQDAVLVVDGDANVVFGNVAATLLFEVSARRLSGGKPLSQFVTFQPDPLTIDGLLPTLKDATQLREVAFTASQGKEGWAQVVIQPQPGFFSSEPSESARWIVCMRDVSLEKTLTEKYKAELDQKQGVIDDLRVARAQLEDYSHNLERMVEERTQALREANQLLKTILDSLGQGILVFDREGRCLPVFSQVCVKLFGVEPAGLPIEDVLGLKGGAGASFGQWRESVYGEMLEFEDLAPLAPSRLERQPPTEIALGYNPMRTAEGALGGIVVIATDRTLEMQAVREAQRERELVKKVVQVARHREAFRLFSEDAQRLLSSLASGEVVSREELERRLHTLKGGAATFGLGSMARDCHMLEDQLKQTDPTAPEFREKLIAKASEIKTVFNQDLEGLIDLLGPLSKNTAVVEVPLVRFQHWASTLTSAKTLEESRRIGREIWRECTETPVASAISHFDSGLKELAERLGKKISDLEVRGGETRVAMERLQPLFASLIHAFRNAIDHGLESPEDRVAVGKSEEGHLSVEFKRSDRELSIVIADDGRGVNVKKLREKLIAAGQKELASQSDFDVAQVILRGEFSTADVITDVSGRGVGVSAIAAEVQALGGTVRVDSVLGKGMTLTIQVPLIEEPSIALAS